MHNQIDFKELKEIQKQIVKGISLNDNFSEIKKIAAFSLTSKDKKMLCAAVVLDAETMEVLEEKEIITDELMQYSPVFVAFREGPAIMEVLKELEQKPDLILVEGFGALQQFKVGTASYIGVLANKPCIGVAKNLMFGRLEEEKIVVNNEVKGFALRIKEFANPVYITPGQNISVETAQSVMSKLVNPEFKMPYPLHLAHKNLIRLKKGETISLPQAGEKESVEQEA